MGSNQFKGVHHDEGSHLWSVHVAYGRDDSLFIGHFETQELAARAHDVACLRLRCRGRNLLNFDTSSYDRASIMAMPMGIGWDDKGSGGQGLPLPTMLTYLQSQTNWQQMDVAPEQPEADERVTEDMDTDKGTQDIKRDTSQVPGAQAKTLPMVPAARVTVAPGDILAVLPAVSLSQQPSSSVPEQGLAGGKMEAPEPRRGDRKRQRSTKLVRQDESDEAVELKRAQALAQALALAQVQAPAMPQQRGQTSLTMNNGQLNRSIRAVPESETDQDREDQEEEDEDNEDDEDDRMYRRGVNGSGQRSRARPLSRAHQSQYIGVGWRRGKWEAEMRFRGKKHRLGRFNNEEDAALAYDQFALEMRGQDTKINFAASLSAHNRRTATLPDRLPRAKVPMSSHVHARDHPTKCMKDALGANPRSGLRLKPGPSNQYRPTRLEEPSIVADPVGRELPNGVTADRSALLDEERTGINGRHLELIPSGVAMGPPLSRPPLRLLQSQVSNSQGRLVINSVGHEESAMQRHFLPPLSAPLSAPRSAISQHSREHTHDTSQHSGQNGTSGRGRNWRRGLLGNLCPGLADNPELLLLPPPVRPPSRLSLPFGAGLPPLQPSPGNVRRGYSAAAGANGDRAASGTRGLTITDSANRQRGSSEWDRAANGDNIPAATGLKQAAMAAGQGQRLVCEQQGQAQGQIQEPSQGQHQAQEQQREETGREGSESGGGVVEGQGQGQHRSRRGSQRQASLSARDSPGGSPARGRGAAIPDHMMGPGGATLSSGMHPSAPSSEAEQGGATHLNQAGTNGLPETIGSGLGGAQTKDAGAADKRGRSDKQPPAPMGSEMHEEDQGGSQGSGEELKLQGRGAVETQSGSPGVHLSGDRGGGSSHQRNQSHGMAPEKKGEEHGSAEGKQVAGGELSALDLLATAAALSADLLQLFTAALAFGLPDDLIAEATVEALDRAKGAREEHGHTWRRA